MFRIAPAAIVILTAAAVCAAQPITPGDTDVPLLETHQALMRARAMMAEQNYAETIPALRKAEEALADFVKQDHGPLGEQAGYMQQDIHSYIPHVGRDATIDQIDEWIGTVEHWKGNLKYPLAPPEPW